MRKSLLLGVHVSIAGHIWKAVDRAADLGCTTFQMFPSNPRSWKAKELIDADVARFRELLNERGLSKFYIHLSYLPNISSPDDELWEKSIAALAEGLRRTVLLGAAGLVTHMGSHKGAGLDFGIVRAADAITRALRVTEIPRKILMEGSAGKSNQVGTLFTELNRVYEAVGDDVKGYVGVCYDTCHSHAMGYDISADTSGFNRALAELDEGIGRDAVGFIHLNDSAKPAGRGVDRHANLGEGTIGAEGLKRFVNHPFVRERNLPICLETPNGETMWPKELAMVREWAE
ncbi:MAG: deoxyribonuclease IV [Candidatus Coatesbacteria bacterium]|nr:MAG: deoxyribonuclease IV [Candidatus Coatesbacteria bacterium]